MSIAGDPRNGSIQERYAWALEQHRLYAARLRQDDLVDRLLAELRAHVAASRESMVAAGLVEHCRICDTPLAEARDRTDCCQYL